LVSQVNPFPLDATEADANLDRGDGAERQRGRGIAKVTSPISLETVVSR
jgi:hypothetical protein